MGLQRLNEHARRFVVGLVPQRLPGSPACVGSLVYLFLRLCATQAGVQVVRPVLAVRNLGDESQKFGGAIQAVQARGVEVPDGRGQLGGDVVEPCPFGSAELGFAAGGVKVDAAHASPLTSGFEN